MNVTDVRIRLLENGEKMKAVASITFDGEFVVHDIKVIDGQNGLFIAMPSKKVGDEVFKDIAHPLNTQVREDLKTCVLTAYENALAQPKEESEATTEEE